MTTPSIKVTTRYESIYANDAARYDAFVRCEDAPHNLPRALAERAPERPVLAIEMGAGSGRVTRLLAPLCERVHAYDASAAMLEVAAVTTSPNVTLAVADNTSIPEADLVGDLVVAGWTFGHTVGAYPSGWEKVIEDVLHEMMRLVSPRGRAVILETLGTCVEAPAAPNAALGAYYTLLERWYGFTREVIRTDYAFASCEQAATELGFFFGDEMGARVRERGSANVPEFTGVWTRAQTRT